MRHNQILDIARQDLLAIVRLRHKLASARMTRSAHALQLAEQKLQHIETQLGLLHNDMRQVQSACVNGTIMGLRGASIYQELQRALNVDIRRTEARKDAQKEACRSLGEQLCRDKAWLGKLDIRLGFYEKNHRKARIILALRADERD